MTGPAVPADNTTPQAPNTGTRRRLPIGVELVGNGLVHARMWAPNVQRVDLVLEDGTATGLQSETNGYFSAALAAEAGRLYRFRLDGGDRLYPDPASRFQPEGPDGPSQIVDPGTFQWSDNDWPGISIEGQVLYELQAFRPAGPSKLCPYDRTLETRAQAVP